MTFDYFYDYESEQFSFIMIPKEMLRDKRFNILSIGSKVLYGIALDRVKLSRKNGWIDPKNRVYIIMTIEEIQHDLDCAKQKAVKMLQELVDFGLIEKHRQGLGKPNILYVKKFVSRVRKSNSKRDEIQTSAGSEITLPEVPKSFVNNTYQNNPDVNNTDSIYPSAPTPSGWTDGTMNRERIKHQIEYAWLRTQFRAEPIDELVEIMLEVAMNRSPTIRIGRDAEYPTFYVQERFSKINAMHIERVMEGIEDNRTQVRNTRAYLLASLFNSVSTLDNHCTMQYNYDFGGSL